MTRQEGGLLKTVKSRKQSDLKLTLLFKAKGLLSFAKA